MSILHQTLVAYEGTRPVYATLVSTGADGLGDPERLGRYFMSRGLLSAPRSGAAPRLDSPTGIAGQ